MCNQKIDFDVCFIGGDKRQLFAAKALSKKTRKNVFVSGDIFSELSRNCQGNLVFTDNPIKAVHLSKAIILSLPAANCEKVLSFLDISSEACRNGSIIIGGNFSPYMLDVMCEEGILYFDYYKDECYALRNAYLTAEGGIKLAMDTLDISVKSAKVIVLGFGRIGKALASMLSGLGNIPTVYARRAEARVLAEEMGYDVTETLDLSGFDVVFNTVPERIISNETLLELPDRRILIELASSPGGFDAEIAAQCAHMVIDGRALPGKYAPQSAGEILAETVYGILLDATKIR